MVIEKEREYKPVFVTQIHAEKYWIDRSRINVAEYITYLSDGEHRPAKHHLEWLYYILAYPSARVNIIAPRGSAKTTLLIYILSWIIGQKPWLNHYIGSVAAAQAQSRLANVREIVEINQRYKNVFPWIQIDTVKPNNAKEFSVWSTRWKRDDRKLDYSAWRGLIAKFGQPKEATLFASGIGAKSVIGHRFNGLGLLDDPHDEENSANPDQRTKVENFLKRTLLPCMVPNTNKHSDSRFVNIGTRWAEDDIPGRLQADMRGNGEPVWKTIDIPAEDEDGNSYWPEYWTKERLQEEREVIGDVMYNLMYLNNPQGLSSGDFSMDMLRNILPDPLPEFKELVISVDLSYSVSTTADYVVFAALARSKTNPLDLFVLDLYREKIGKIGKLIRELGNFADDIFEKYGQLNWILFQKAGGDPAYGVELMEKRSDLPVKFVSTKGDKETRLKSVALVAQRNRMFVNTKMKHYQAMCSELIAFPGPKDDICDALSLPFQTDSWGDRGYQRAGKVNIKSPFLL